MGIGELDTTRCDIQQQKAKTRPVEPASIHPINLVAHETLLEALICVLIYDNGVNAGRN